MNKEQIELFDLLNVINKEFFIRKLNRIQRGEVAVWLLAEALELEEFQSSVYMNELIPCIKEIKRIYQEIELKF